MDCLSNNNIQARPNFRAYHANEKTISRVLGASVGADVKKVRGQMEDLANDVDIYLFPDKGEKPDTDALVMFIKDPLSACKNKAVKFVKAIRRIGNMTKTPYKSAFIFPSMENVSNDLVELGTRRKKTFLESKVD